MADYFDNPTTGTAQYRAQMLGAQVETGEYSFSGTGTTVQVPTRFSKVYSALALPKQTLGNEQLFCDLTIDADSDNGAAITVSRVSHGKEFHFAIDNAQVTSNNLSATPLMVAPVAMTLTKVYFYHRVVDQGGSSLVLNLGKVGDDDHFVDEQGLDESANSTTEISTFANDGAVAADDVLIASTAGGTSWSAPDICISITADIAATSGLVFTYFFIGLP